MSAPRWWWLSFVDPARAQGDRFLGVAVVQAEDELGAVKEAWKRKINPGGEVMTVRLGEPPARLPKNCLMGKDEARAWGAWRESPEGPCANCGASWEQHYAEGRSDLWVGCPRRTT